MAAFVPNLGGAGGGDGRDSDDDDRERRLQQAYSLMNQLTGEKDAALAELEKIQQAYNVQDQQLANALTRINQLEAQLHQNERTRDQEQQQAAETVQQLSARIMHLEEQLAQKDAQISQLQNQRNQGAIAPPFGNVLVNQAPTAADEQSRSDLLRSYSPDEWFQRFQRFHEAGPGGDDGSADETNGDGAGSNEGDPAAGEGQ